MTNRELVDSAWAEVTASTISGSEWQKRVTYGYKGKPYNWQNTAFGRAKLLLDQVTNCVAPPPASSPLTWKPPVLTNPVTVVVPVTGAVPTSGSGGHIVQLQAGVDYILDMGLRRNPDAGGLSIVGGRNIVMIGGEIEIMNMPDSQEWRREGLVFHNQTGVVHVEGVWINGGDAAAEGGPCRGIVMNANCVFQIQNCRLDNITMWHRNFATPHSDALITWKSPTDISRCRVNGSASTAASTGRFRFPKV